MNDEDFVKFNLYLIADGLSTPDPLIHSLKYKTLVKFSDLENIIKCKNIKKSLHG